MPLITGRENVQGVYCDAAQRGWVIPAFGVENLTTAEAVLCAATQHGRRIGCADVPIILAMTNLYPQRRQSVNYTHTRKWDIGLRLFLADLAVITSSESPFASPRVMVHLDHIQHDLDRPLLAWDMTGFSSIMFDASTLPFAQNIEATRKFMGTHGERIVVEAACDEIAAGGGASRELTTSDRAEEFLSKTRVDLLVANLGSEHRASSANVYYDSDRARQIRERIGSRLVLHGCSSVPRNQLRSLFEDGIRKVNVWTALERDSSPKLMKEMVVNAAKVIGSEKAQLLKKEGLLGPKVDASSSAQVDYFTTCYRQSVIFEAMKECVLDYLAIWYT
jgi:fructose/tagatose bisphosphate aldolase